VQDRTRAHERMKRQPAAWIQATDLSPTAASGGSELT
jgi:hypothetical protein